jgi:hypothetical protein
MRAFELLSDAAAMARVVVGHSARASTAMMMSTVMPAKGHRSFFIVIAVSVCR